ncbi:MAG: hypothetical protein JJT82_06280 [Legionellaceae bacterium]|nr:hypothetical protein [Legionellaceae bacterium]
MQSKLSLEERVTRKYAMKQLMAQLRHQSSQPYPDHHRKLQMIDRIMQHYHTWYQQPIPHTTEAAPLPTTSLDDAFHQWQDLHCQLHRHFDVETQAILQQQLWTCLYTIRYWIQQDTFEKAQGPDQNPHALFNRQQPRSEAWLQWLGDLICVYKQQSHWATPFCQNLTDEELKKLARSFKDKDIRTLFNSLFYYKLHPEDLVTPSSSSEEQLQYRKQLTDLYAQIERLFQALQHEFIQRYRLQLPDHLYHGDELPPAVSFQPAKEHAAILRSLLSHYPESDTVTEAAPLANPVLDLLRAYKFWFNPIRLINAVMAIWMASHQQGQSLESNQSLFRKQLTSWFQHASTSLCIDLFGYFTNKDTRYLLRTLEYAANGRQDASLPQFSPAEKEQIAVVHALICAMIDIVQEELQNRNITTELPPPPVGKKAFTPGKRNLQALTHICNYYCSPRQRDNTVLKQLMDSIEHKEQ